MSSQEQTASMADICTGDARPGEVVRDLLDHLGDKWTLLVVGMLGDGPVRYTHLRNKIPGISQRMLTLTLKKLERDGLASRQSFAEVPPRVEYQLTDLGFDRRLRRPAVFHQWPVARDESVNATQRHHVVTMGTGHLGVNFGDYHPRAFRGSFCSIA